MYKLGIAKKLQNRQQEKMYVKGFVNRDLTPISVNSFFDNGDRKVTETTELNVFLHLEVVLLFEKALKEIEYLSTLFSAENQVQTPENENVYCRHIFLGIDEDYKEQI